MIRTRKKCCTWLNKMRQSGSESTSMKSRQKTLKRTRQMSPLRRVARLPKQSKERTLLERIAEVTDQLQILRSRLANAGDDLPAVGTHRIASLGAALERLWELRRQEQSAPLRATALSDEEEKVLAFPSGSRPRAS